MAAQEDMELQVIHDCLTKEVQGAILPGKRTGFINTPLYRTNSRHVSELIWSEYLDDIRQNLEYAYERFGTALKIHDDWEKIYIENTDFDALNALTSETIIRLLGDQSLERSGREYHHYFGASTIEGSFDYIDNLTADVPKRYFIKGRPGTGKSTFLKKIATSALKQGFDVEAYHCSFDPDSWDMVILRELGLCLFDSTSPHEYFPERPEDEIIDIYESCVKPGTDEEYADEIAGYASSYQFAVGQGRSHLQLIQRIYSDLKLRIQIQLPEKRLDEEIERFLNT